MIPSIREIGDKRREYAMARRMAAFASCFALAMLFLSLSSAEVRAKSAQPPVWTFTPVLKAFDSSGTELSSPVNIRPEDREKPVRVGLYVEVRETEGILRPKLYRKVKGQMGISSFGGAVYFSEATPGRDDSDAQRPAPPDISAMVAKVIDRLGPEEDFHTRGGFLKVISTADGAKWQLGWLLAPGLGSLRGAWCSPGEDQPLGKRSCMVSLGSIHVPVSGIAEGAGVSLTVGGPRVVFEPVLISPLSYLRHPDDLKPVIEEGNTIVLKVLL